LDSAGQIEPKTGLAGKFSVYFCAALALAEGAAGEDKFTDQKVLDPHMVALRKKVKAQIVPEFKDTEARVTITTKDGQKYTAYVTTPKGDPRNPPSDQELEDKFRSLAAFILPETKINRLAKTIWSLDEVKNIRNLIKLCLR
jgi:2-methylcitrate dehydratase PrpD